MKVITWNCNMAFRKKAGAILSYKPDLLIIQECEHPDKLNSAFEIQKPTSALWFGENKNKGLGIFSYNSFVCIAHQAHNPQLRMIVPVNVTGGELDFVLYAIWANNPDDPDGQYIEQVWKAIHYYDQEMSNKQTMLIGDFNSNTIWDKKRRESNHSNVVKLLNDKGIYSSYHLHHHQTQGLEQHPTLYMYRHKNKPCHIDYCFASSDLADKIESVEVGEFEYWMAFSDHVPLMVNFDFAKNKQ